jgi:uncharacterized protein YcnI
VFSSWLHRKAYLVVVGALLGVATLVLAMPAWAHVTVHPSSVPAGSHDIELAFRVPNERDNANTVTVQVFLPTDLPLLTVDVRPIPGWSAKVNTKNLSTPVQTDDGPVSQIVSDVTWTASAGGIAPGQYQDFEVAAGSVPDRSGLLVFKALQTYSSGEIVRWIEVPTAGQPPPDLPAPVLTLRPDSKPSATVSRPVPSSTAGSTSAPVLAIVALALAAVDLVGLLLVLSKLRSRARVSG